MPGVFSSPKPEPLPPIPTREDPSIADARRKTWFAEKQRRGRSATITAGGEGQLGDAPVNRPGLRTSKLLGG